MSNQDVSPPPQVSVIIVSYNGAKYIEANLESLARQYRPGLFEVIVVDNASTDQTVPICQGCSEVPIQIIENTGR